MPVGGLIAPYGISFGSPALMAERAEGVRQQTRRLLKAASAKVNPWVQYLIRVDEFRGPGAAQGNKTLGQG